MSFKNAFKNYPIQQSQKEGRKMNGMEAYFEQIKERLRVEYPDTLFPPTFADIQEACKQKRCLLCGCKLYLMRNAPRYRCKSVKHKKSFTISSEKLERIAKM